MENKEKVVFIDICKTASTSIRTVFWGSCFEGRRGGAQRRGQRHQQVSGNRHIEDLTQKQIKECTIFTVVRNPYDRIVSQYFWGFSASVGSSSYYGAMSFKKFIQKFLRDGGWKINHTEIIHFQNQFDWLEDKEGKIQANYILRFENLEEDFNDLLRNLNLPQTKLPKLKAAKDRSGFDRQHYSKYYDKETKRIVETFYKKDLEYFKYSFNESN